MTEDVVSRIEDATAVITLSRPPENSLTGPTCASLDAALTAAIANDTVRGIVITGEGPNFSTGIDLDEYERKDGDPGLRHLCRKIEDSPIPITCALTGMVAGAAFELALACHARIAESGTRISLGDIRLGMIPSAGATQRLPRLIGARAALEILLSGRLLSAQDPLLRQVMKQITIGDPVPAARALVQALAGQGDWQRSGEATRGFADPAAYVSAVGDAASKVKSAAGKDILRCVEAALLLPFERGLDLEETLFLDRLRSTETRALRHLALCAQKANARFASPGTKEISDIVVIGSDELGARAVAVALRAGGRVSVLEPDNMNSGLHRILHEVRSAHAHMDDTQIQRVLDRLDVTSTAEALGKADLVLDGGQGRLRAPSGLKPECLWVGLRQDVTPERAGAAGRLGGFGWLHLQDGAEAPQIAEWAVPEGAGAALAGQLAAFLRKAGILLVETARPPAEALSQSLNAAMWAAACELVAHGACPYEVDAAARHLGFAKGPFQRMDERGLRVCAEQITSYALARKLPEVDLSLLHALADKGRDGRSAARGVYVHSAQGPQRDPVMAALVEDLAAGHDADLPVSDLSLALHAALVTEAARLLSEGRALQAGDLDLIMVRAMGMTRRKGGALFQADLSGMLTLLRAMQRYEPLSVLWAPAPMIHEMVKNGQGFFRRNPR